MWQHVTWNGVYKDNAQFLTAKKKKDENLKSNQELLSTMYNFIQVNLGKRSESCIPECNGGYL